MSSSDEELISVLMIGTGEYTTGYVHGQASDSDKVISPTVAAMILLAMFYLKGAGVVALSLFDLRRRGKVGRLGLCGVNGTKVLI